MSSKKRLTTKDIGLALTRFALDKKQIDEHIAAGLSLTTAAEKSTIATELAMLRVVATETAITSASGHGSRERNGVRESYHECLKSISGKISAQLDAPRGITFYEAINLRSRIYREACTRGENSLCWRVGTAFAKLCGRVGDVETIWFGRLNFSLTLNDTCKRLGASAGRTKR
jgi:hypothetical protein